MKSDKASANAEGATSRSFTGAKGLWSEEEKR